MLDKKFTNRKVDNMSVEKSKKYLWRYIQNKTQLNEVPASKKIGEFFRNLFTIPGRFVPVSAVAVLIIIAVIFNSTLQGWLFGGGGLEMPTVYASFEMNANQEDSSGIESGTSFTLTASEDLDVKDVKAVLEVSPEVELDVRKVEKNVYKVDPKENLEGNEVYNFTIASETGEYSWAYQVKDTFKITGALPSDKATQVPTNTGIEIYFSHENFDFDNVKNYFEISPKVEGSFEHHRRSLVFVPKGGLEPAKIYTVILKKGFPLSDSNQVLNKDFTFAFETEYSTSMAVNNYYYFHFIRDYYEIPTNSPVALQVSTERKEGIEVEVYKYKDVDQYILALEESFKIPNWCYATKELFKHDVSNLQSMGTFKSVGDTFKYNPYIYLLDADFGAGYYLFQIKDGIYTDQALVQVTDLSNYIISTLTKTLVWANDLSTGKPIDGATVEVPGIETLKTSKGGVGEFVTPEDWKVDYDKAETKYVKVTAPDGKTLVTPITPYTYEGIGGQYWKHLDTDRSTYKPVDTIKFWGYLQSKTTGNNDNVKIKIIKDWATYVKEMPVEFNNDNTFSGEFDIENYSPGYYYLSLEKGDKTIYKYSFEVADYVKPAYNLEVTSNKKAYFAGETIEYDIKSTFFEGTPVPNLDLQYYSDGKQNIVKTDENGEASLTFDSEKQICLADSDYCSDIHYRYFDVEAVFAEEASLWASSNVRIFDSYLNIQSEREYEDGIAKLLFKTNWVDLDKVNNSEDESYSDYLGDLAGDRIIKGEVTEITWDKIETGEYYDFIDKQTKKTYQYVKKTRPLDPISVTTNGEGEASYSFKVEEGKYYKIFLSSDDDHGGAAHDTIYVYGSNARSNDYDDYNVNFLNGGKIDDQYLYGMWTNRSAEFNENETVKTVFSNGDVPLAENSDGKFLFLILGNGVQDYIVQDSPYFDFEFTKKNIPNVYVDSIWFTGKKYENAYEGTALYKKDLKALDISVEADKDNYKPGEEVTLEVNVVDSDGKPVKGKVNLNLVDEAFFKIAYDNFTDPLDSLYMTISSGVISDNVTHNNIFNMKTAAEGGGCFTGDTRILMADGSYKAIKDIGRGDKILTKKHEFSGEFVGAEVTNTVSHFVSEYLVVNENLEVTKVHTVFVNGAWDMAGNLKIGDTMLGKNGEEIRVYSIRRVSEPVWVYNFEVAGYHTYFANDYYVHNNKGGDVSVRQNFLDTAYFDLIETDSFGNGEATFKLPDNVTSWRVMAAAIDPENFKGGIAVSNIDATLPFFTDLIVNDQYSIKDSPMIKFRSYGDDLKEGDSVDYWVEAPSLGVKESDKIGGKAFSGSYFELPKLKYGKHDVTVYADSKAGKDALKKTVEVKGSRLKKDVVEFIREVNSTTIFELGKDSPTYITLMDGGIAFYYYDLLNLYHTYGDRLDQRLSRIAAADLFQKYFGEKRDASDDDLVQNYQKKGLTLLPYSDADLRLSAMVMYVETDISRYDTLTLKDYFYGVYGNKDSNLEDVTLSLLGLASMGEPVLLSLKEIKDAPELNTEQKLYIALGFEALGAKVEAREIYKEVFNELAKNKKSAYITALGAMLAAGLGDDQAATLLLEFVEQTGIEDDIANLYELGYLKNSLGHVSATPAKFKIKYESLSEIVELDKWETFDLMAFPDDIVGVSVSEGQLAAVLSYADETTPESFPRDKRVSIEREYFVKGQKTISFKEGDVVEVVLSPKFDNSREYTGGAIEMSAFKITDILPSGLAPVTSPRVYNEYQTAYFPYRIEGQEVSFFWDNIDYNKSIKYLAKVVNPGKFYAEPAKIENFYYEDIANISEPAYVQISPVTKN